MKAEKIIRLRMQNSIFCRRIPVVQGDTARTFRFILEDITLDGTEHARIYARKPSGAEVYDECEVVGSNEVIFTPETEQIFIETGIILAEIRVAKGEKLITSYSFEFEVRQSTMRTGDIPSSDEFNALERAIEEAKGLHEPEFTEAGKRENIVSGETMQILFGKIKKWFTDLGALITKIGNKDISSIGDGTVTGAITDLDKRNTKNTSDIDVERKRIDNIAKLPEGSTAGDAELADIRVAADGTVYDTAGESVRGQINQIDQKYEKETGSLKEDLVDFNKATMQRKAMNWHSGGYVNKEDGSISTCNGLYYSDYIEVYKGQIVDLHLSCSDDYDSVCLYDNTEDRNYLGIHYGSNYDRKITIKNDCLIRCSADARNDNIEGQYIFVYEPNILIYKVEKIENEIENSNVPISYFIKDYDKRIVEEQTRNFYPSTDRKNYNYLGNVDQTKRFVAFGIDDFRNSDFSFVLPLFNKYCARGTFNRINYTSTLSDNDKNKIKNVLLSGSEFGDHTHYHYQYIYSDPLIDGKTYPSNDQIRTNIGNGKNIFGMNIYAPMSVYCPWFGDTTTQIWKLTDSQCEEIRKHWSIMFNDSDLLTLLDSLSNRYLGTTGSSKNSYDKKTHMYTGGIFTGALSSCNHEIWERIALVTQHFYKKEIGLNADLRNWSLPGTYYGYDVSPFRVVDGDKYYFDTNKTLPYNYTSKFYSSIFIDDQGNAKKRSWNDVLREYGYTSTTDNMYPSRADGIEEKAMSIPLFLNENLSRNDAVLFPTMNTRSFHYDTITDEYPSTFFTGTKTKAEEMYESEGSFYEFVEKTRMNTANGIIQCEQLDSADTYSERIFIEEILKFCKKNRIEVVSISEAYDIAFNNNVNDGNLIYNSTFKNTAKEYFPNLDNVPNNPGGYNGNCYAIADDSQNKLVVEGDTTYINYGVPYGYLKFTVKAKGNGYIHIYDIRNGNKADLSNCNYKQSITVNTSSFADYSLHLFIPNNAIDISDSICDGYANKIMGIKIIYTGGIEIMNPSLTLE
ncbi:polysaccharide deacetylase family protein [Dorea longicatena]|uniref:polysaccharide deacetylase family protein n=1 Tax=Dorea longicatena TaxID=88431 RepID=UPI0011060F73|nr:polysaccharide deacetylase family protein [Dorea longicatena]